MMRREKLQESSKLIILTISIISIIVISCVDSSTGSDDVDKGTEKKILEGGERGKVPFAHRIHQEKLGDCNICHSFFPKEPGSIQKMIKKGDLKKKQVMKKLCVKCHKAERMAGNPYGPTTCSKCHIK